MWFRASLLVSSWVGALPAATLHPESTPRTRHLNAADKPEKRQTRKINYPNEPKG